MNSFQPSPSLLHALFTGLLLSWLIVTPPPARATIPEPDNVLHGTIFIGNEQVTAAQDHVVVEVRRPTGDVVASYRMGQNPAFGDHYVVDVPLESVGNPISAAASLFGNNLVVVVLDNGMEQYSADYVVNERGTVQEMNFGSQTSTTGYDAWEMAWGLPLGSGLLDADGDGDSNTDEYVAGTDPLDPNDKFTLSIQTPSPGGDAEIEWYAREASGLGYEGKSRFYALEQVTDLATDTWTGVTGFTNVLGNNQLILYTGFATNGVSFYRGRVWLEP